MKTHLATKLAIIIAGIICFASCKEKQPQFVIEGKIDGADSTVLYLERRSLTEVKTIDSVKISSDGNFKFEEAALGYAEFYLLKLNGQVVNIAVDSTETITINTSKSNFATEYTVEGSEQTNQIKEVTLAQYKLSQAFKDLSTKFTNKELSQSEYVSQVQQAIEDYKNLARSVINSDYKSLAAYFALFQKVDSYLIFDPMNKKDRILFQAVATAWDQYRPESPRTEQIREFTLTALAEVKRLANQEKALNEIEATEAESSTFFNISLPNIKNEEISLSSLKGKVVILDFTAYQTEYSPAHNILINNVYSKHKSAIEVYQVSFDSDLHVWQNTATNLPWICVRDSRSLNSELLAKFNIQGLPTTYLVDKNGSIVKRLSPSDNLATEIQRIL
ncbi:TlpA disulfide reductase family protein [Dysgonomonas sp. ZJ279]|uniref:TlpA disulfide reductase family protein n=1 Tax=Dysgonomonas sp. ZJ279 TaxID=2709796 RepID=UPI0013EDE038|nr:TlpA disulfide reductase family protein [Dysgonomonas sp. ZJ279]